MEQKGPSGTVPQLGRIALKRVAVPRAQVAPPQPTRNALVAEPDKAVRKAVAAHLPRDRFQTWTFEDADSAYDHFGQNAVDLVILGRELPGMAGTVLAQMMRNSRKGSAVAILLMSPSYRDPYLGAGDCNAFGADAFLALPAAPDVLMARVEAALSKREPVARLDLLPKPLAEEIDRLYGDLEHLNYYDLLGLAADTEPDDLQRRFHELSLQLHPDRHTRLRGRAPHVWEKINAVYKRLSEAYKVLVDPPRRRSYNLGLRRRGKLRLEKDSFSAREDRELALCETDDARRHVLESLELRSLGDLEGAGEAMARALEFEPDNEELGLVLSSIRKLLSIVERDG